MTTKLKWRLGKLPDSFEVATLLDKGILTKDEAREILFSLETDEDRDNKSLQEEITFLRSLVKSLADRQTIVSHIYQAEKPYTQKPWYQQYQTYCMAPMQSALTNSVTNTLYSAGLTGTSDDIYQLNASNSSGSVTMNFTTEPDFTSIKTF